MPRLVIYHTSDIHAASGFGDKLARIVEPGSLLVDCGDALAGSSTVYKRNEPVMKELAKAPYAAMAVGNREFNYAHAWFLERARKLSMPLVCSNLVDLRRRTPAFVPTLNVSAAGVPIRVLGLLVPQYRTGSGWEKIFGWRFLDADAALRQSFAQPTQASLTILLSHLGLSQDRELAARWPGIGVILGGHSHDVLEQPEMVNGIPIVHAGSHARSVARLELALAETGQPTGVSSSLLSLKTP
jgi:2',3'-cyclic-nucleotide 2'-phosphodiesterase (5'-nucleotidase family)